jgi:hypothetical protein
MEELAVVWHVQFSVTYRKDALFDIFVELFFINEVFSLPTAAEIEYCVSNDFTYDSNKSCVIPFTLMILIQYLLCVMIAGPVPSGVHVRDAVRLLCCSVMK